MYPWPIGDFDNAMDVALETAMNYLEHTGQATRFPEVQRVAAMAIVAANRAVAIPMRVTIPDAVGARVNSKAERAIM